jgi:hypothetical protein
MPASDMWTVGNFEQRLVAMTEHFDTFLEKYDREHPMVFRDRIMREQYPLFNGLSQKTQIWHPGLGPQAGISDWTSIQVSTVGGGQDAGYNACVIDDPQTYTYGVEAKEYSGKTTEWRSPVICVKDTMWTEEARKQVGYIYGMGIMITSQAWEVYSREMYMKFASDADNLYVLAEGDLLGGTSPKFEYDPFTTYTYNEGPYSLDERITVLKLDAGVEVSTLNFSYLDLLHTFIADESPGAALGNEGGLPTVGLMLHLHDFEKMFRDDPDLRQDMRYATPSMLFDNYAQTFKTMRGWGIIHDRRQMRFKYWKIGGDSKLWFRRVLPMREGRALAIGNLPEVNPDYHTAEIAVAVAFLKDVFKIRIPPKVDSLGAQTSFGPAPGFSGDWQWINYPSDSNPLREIGYHYMRMAAFPAPLRYSTRALAFAYRRCPQTWPSNCNLGDSLQAAEPTEAIALAVDAVAGDFDATNETLTVTLAKRFLDTAASIGDSVLVTQTGAGDTTVVGTLVGDLGAPTYTLAFDSTEYAKLDITYLTTAVGTVTLT